MRLAIVRALGAMALGLLAGLAAIPANAMPPAGICRIGQALDAHRNGLALERSANWKGARSQWLELARMGWSPAQSRLARLMAAKKGGGAKRNTAADEPAARDDLSGKFFEVGHFQRSLV